MSAVQRALNERQKRFANEYIIDFNATQAAIRAGYSKQTAYSQGHDLLKHPEIKKFINSVKEKVIKKLEISQERTITEMGRIAYMDPRKLFNANGSPKAIHQLDDDTAATISSIEFETKKIKGKTTSRVSRIRFWDKNKPLEMLGKHFKIYEDITPVQVTNNTIDLNSLNPEQLKLLYQLKQKLAKK